MRTLGVKYPVKGKYVVAVSGGVDSAVLLDLLSGQKGLELIVAHFDHGIREDSYKDREFVAKLAKNYGLPFEYSKGKLGSAASEDTARRARYEFLRSVKEKHKAKAIITAHQQDDVIETAIINMIRGTHNRGLSALQSGSNVLRPLLNVPRAQIENYAQKQGLEWREDPTNKDTRYLRNYVRLSVVPALSRQDGKWREKLLNNIERSGRIDREITTVIDRLADDNLHYSDSTISIPKNWLIMLPNQVGIEVMKYAINKLDQRTAVDKALLKNSLLFAKTARPGKKKPLNANLHIEVNQREVGLKLVP